MNQKKSVKAFSIVELAFLVSVMSLSAISYFSYISNINIDNNNKLKITKNRIAAIEKSLIAFKNQMGRLPCPASATKSIYPTFGGFSENITNTNDTSTNSTLTSNVTLSNGNECASNSGAVPTRSLSLPPEYALDGWGMRINYVVSSNLCGNNSLTVKNCTPASFSQNEGNLSADYVYPTSNLSPITDAIYLLISYGGYQKSSSSYSADGIVASATSSSSNASVLGSGYFTYHKTKNQFNALASDPGLNILSLQDCLDNSYALNSITANTNSATANGTMNIRTYLTVTERIDTNVTNTCSTVANTYNCGDEAVLAIMWALQDACYLLYPTGITKLCPGGGTYNSTNDNCTCTSTNWNGTC